MTETHAFSHPRVNAQRVQQRLAELGMSKADLAARCDMSTEQLNQQLSGVARTRPSSLMRMAVALCLSFNELVKLPATSREVVSTLVGLAGRVPAKERERALDDAHALLTLRQLLAPVAQDAPLRLLSVGGFTRVSAAVHAVRRELGRETSLNAAHFLCLFRKMGVHVSPSLYGSSEAQHWTQLVRLLGDVERMVVFTPAHARADIRLRGLAEAYAHCLLPHDVETAKARRFATRLARGLLGESSIEAAAPLSAGAAASTSEAAFVTSARCMGMGAVMDAVQAFQLADGGRNHAFVARALRVHLGDAYALSGALYPRIQAGCPTLPAEQTCERSQ